MKFILSLALFAVLGLSLASCSSSVDRKVLEQQIAAAELKVAKINEFIQKNQPLVEQLAKLAEETGDQKIKDAAEVLRASVAQAAKLLPTAQEELAAVKTTVANLAADAEGKVPWYAVAGGIALNYVPKIAAFIFPQLAPIAALFANLNWSLTATKKQKDEEAAQAVKASA